MVATTAAPALRVLVVDDYPDTVESTAILLKLDGHEVETATDGVQGIGRATAFRPHLVLLDIGLAALDGYQVAGRIRDLGLPPKPLIVAVTGYGMTDDKHRSGEAGFDLHLLKPVDPETYRGLAALLQTSTDLVNRAHALAAQYRAAASEIMFRQLEMANTYLDAAHITGRGNERYIARATESYERLTTWLGSGACIDDRAAGLVNGLRALNERLKLMRQPYGRFDSRKHPPRVEIKRQGSQ